MPTSSSPVWDNARFARYPKLDRDLRCEVLVIGGGITGLTAAYLLKQAGKRVCLLERGRLANGDTGCTTAHLTAVTDLRLGPMAERFGKDTTRAVWAAGMAAIGAIQEIVTRHDIACEFGRVPGYLHAPLGPQDAKETDTLRKDAETALTLGIEAAFLPRVPLIGRPGVRFANQAKFHPLKYLAALARVSHGGRCTLFEQSEVGEFSEKPGSVKVNGHTVRFDYVVIATHVPLAGNTGAASALMFQSKLAPYSSYVISATVPKDLPEACFWDISDPYFYLRVDKLRARTRAVFGGLDHKTGQDEHPESRFAALAKRLQRLIPTAKVDHRWSGQVIQTNDGLPYIGASAERQFIATGYGGNGMTFGTIAAMMARDAVLGHRNPWVEIFAVKRRKLRGGTWSYLSENIDYPFFLTRDRLRRPPSGSPHALRPGQAQVLKVRGERVACARDEDGTLTTVSAICTHMGCVVHWNDAERTWDCPCHGSRFKRSGEVIAGPAEEPLAAVAAPAPRKRRVRAGGSPSRA